MTGLRATIAVRLGSLDLELALDASDGETVALLGPNGSGKTTALRALAGLRPVDGGRIELDGDVLDDPVTGTWVPPEARPVGVVFQDHLLFPHLSALDNVAYGLRRAGVRRAEARTAARGWLARVGLGDHEGNHPAQLSGGQAQRVALARALAPAPRILLLDEPLSALDAGTRVHMRTELRRHLASFAGIRVLVTHDPLDALALADRVVVLEEGRVVQTGTIPEIAARPRSRYVAELVGVNLHRGRADGTSIHLERGGELHTAEPHDGEVWALVHPAAVALHRERPAGSPRNVWAVTAVGLDLRGDRVRVRLDGQPAVVAEVTAAAVDELHLHDGGGLWAAVKATEVAVYPV